MDDGAAVTFASASAYLCTVAERIGTDDWERPGLGEWSVLELLAHANRSHDLVAEYLEHPRPPEPPDSPYFAASAIAGRARQAVAALGDDPVAAVRRSAVSALALVARTPAEAQLGSPLGTMSLAAYLPSRVAELVLHGDDLAGALGLALAPPEEAVAETLSFLTGLAGRRGRGLGALRALSGRGDPPSGFSVY